MWFLQEHTKIHADGSPIGGPHKPTTSRALSSQQSFWRYLTPARHASKQAPGQVQNWSHSRSEGTNRSPLVERAGIGNTDTQVQLLHCFCAPRRQEL
jgi:hypothetical protein